MSRPLRRADGTAYGRGCMTVAELRAMLAAIPDETLVLGTWEGIYEPLKGVALVTHGWAGEPFVELDVDSI